MKLTVSYDFLPKTRSTRSSIVMDHFGVGFETGRHVIADGLELPIQSGDVVCFTGASGSGKSSLMRAAASQLKNEVIIDLDELCLPETILVDAIDLPVEESLPLLSACGMGEAHLMLRTSQELSDGQRYRFRLALALSHKPRWIIADEFSATLDRTLAKVVAFNVRRTADRTGTGFLVATTHEDILEDLSPNVHVECRLSGEITVQRSAEESPTDERAAGLKKKRASRLPMTSSSPTAPRPTGRTFLAGITAATRSVSRGL